MKAETFFLVSDAVRATAIQRILEMPVDGNFKVTVASAGGKSSRQRGLQWMWYTNVADSGMGGRHEETKDSVHLFSKYKFGLPIMLRDDEFSAGLYNAWFDKYGEDPERMAWFVEHHVHTEKFNVAQMAEYLTEFQHYYSSRDVPLANPDDMGLLRG